MKILLTGKPEVGKSTILQKVKDGLEKDVFGIVVREIRENGERVGFESVNTKGDSKVFSHSSLFKSKFVVENKFFVDIEVIDSFVVPEIKRGLNNPDALIFIDEIGRMQAFSKKFLRAIDEILNSDSNILGTIVFDPEPWSLEFKKHPEVILVTVTEKNRNDLPDALLTIFKNTHLLKDFNKSQRRLVLNFTREYFAKEQLVQVKKLFNNALFYLDTKKVAQKSDNQYTVIGNTNDHVVKIKGSKYFCDCDLFNGRGQFKKTQGECSHIQAVKLFRLINKDHPA